MTTQKPLKLPELKVLKVPRSCAFILKTPKLETLSCPYIQYLQFEHPETIKWLESDYYGADFMSKFCNVEVFNVTGEFRAGDLGPNLLTIWTNLKELSIRPRYIYTSVERFKSSLADLQKQSEITRGEKLRCYIDDVPLIDESLLNDHNPNSSSDFRLKHHKLLRCSQPDISQINYNKLINLAPELSSDFFIKFPAIKKIETTGPVDPDQFGWALKNASKLCELKLINTSLDQAYLDNLPNIIVGKLDTLMINGTNTSFFTDFNFILRFGSLRLFETNQQFESSLDLAAKAFQQAGFVSFSFREGDELVFISRIATGKGSYHLVAYQVKNVGKMTYSLSNSELTRLIDLWKQRKNPVPQPVSTSQRKRSKPGSTPQTTKKRKTGL